MLEYYGQITMVRLEYYVRGSMLEYYSQIIVVRLEYYVRCSMLEYYGQIIMVRLEYYVRVVLCQRDDSKQCNLILLNSLVFMIDVKDFKNRVKCFLSLKFLNNKICTIFK